MSTSLATYPTVDPSAESEVAAKPGEDNTPAPKQRKRRSPEEIAALKEEAERRGFKDYKAMERHDKKVAAESIACTEEQVELPLEEEKEKPAIDTGRRTGIAPGQSWNLGGTIYQVSEIHGDGSITFTPNG